MSGGVQNLMIVHREVTGQPNLMGCVGLASFLLVSKASGVLVADLKILSCQSQQQPQPRGDGSLSSFSNGKLSTCEELAIKKCPRRDSASLKIFPPSVSILHLCFSAIWVFSSPVHLLFSTSDDDPR